MVLPLHLYGKAARINFMSLGNYLVQLVSKFLMKQRPARKSYLSDYQQICDEIRLGDVILVEGRSYASHMVQRLTCSAWSHAALYIGRLQDIEDYELKALVRSFCQESFMHEHLVIESYLGRGTIVSPLRAYKDDHVRICRPAGISRQDIQRVIRYVAENLGGGYNLRQFLDLGRFLVGGRLIPRNWNSILFREDRGKATQEVCSSLIAKAFTSVHFPILPQIREDHPHHYQLIHRNPKLFTPSDFDYSPYFNIIKYPIFILSEKAPYYSELPWDDSGKISNQ